MDSTRPIRALVRGLEALTVLNSRDGGTVSEVAQEIQLPRTTVYRILETLCASGFVVRDSADERYRLTVRVRALSTGFHEESWITQVAKPCLFELGESIVWPVNIATLAETQLIVREATDHCSPLAIQHFSAGTTLPLLSSSAGHAYLAYCADAERTALIDASSRSGSAEPLASDSPQMPPMLAEVVELGYAATTRSDGLVDEVSMSVPVNLQPGYLAVLTVRFSASAVPLKTGVERFLPKLRHCAARISAAFRKTVDARAHPTRTTA